MKKKFLAYILVFAVSMVLLCLAHTYFFSFSSQFEELIKASYIYLGFFTIVLCFSFSFLQKSKKFGRQLGFIYLFIVPLKIILFIGIFKNQFFGQSFGSKKEIANILIIIFLTLFFEVLFLRKLLNDSKPVKNVE